MLVVGLALATLARGHGVPPVYDGIGIPPEPYRWESPPPNFRGGNKPPLSGAQSVSVRHGQVDGGTVRTGDNQVVIYFGQGAFVAPAGSTTVTCAIVPDPNPPALPTGVALRGNVYRITCAAQPGGASATAVSTYQLTMRFPPGAFKEIQYDDGRGWRPLSTHLSSGGEPYAGAAARGFGEFAATAPTGAQSGDSIFGTLSRYVEFYGILAFVMLFGVIAIVQEIRRRQKQAPTPTLPSKRGRGR
jgi:hypothetical protein